MLIKALCDYYDVLETKRDFTGERLIPKEQYSNVSISYLVSLTKDGKIAGIQDIRKQKENRKKIFPRTAVFPKRTEKSAIEANIIEHRAAYLFGLNFDTERKCFTTSDATLKAKKSHDAFVAATETFMEDLKSPVCKAFLQFARTWIPDDETQNEFLMEKGKDLLKSGLAFCLVGEPDKMLHEDIEVKEKWERYYAEKKANEADLPTAQCSIYGIDLPIARIHGKIKGVPGNTTGSSLVCFNNTSEESYGNEQAFNSGVSSLAMQHYTTALNYLLSSQNHRIILDDLVILHWAADGSEAPSSLMNMLTFGGQQGADETDATIHKFMEGVRDGLVSIDLDGLIETVNPDVDFYIVGFKPSSSRLSVKFFYKQRFGKLAENLLQHQQDMRMHEDGRPIAFWQITKQLTSPKSNKLKVDPSVMVKLLNSAVNGYRYPVSVYQTVLRRVKTDLDEQPTAESQAGKPFRRNDYVRMGILKAYINRENRFNGQKEEIIMALDESNTNPAYLCGRLFAVLENLQQKASGYNLNRTIKDAFFSAAVSRPATTFPKLLSLAQHHLRKLEKPGYVDQNIQELTARLGTSFPDMLSLKDQGVFILGYYQQKNDIINKIKNFKNNQEETA